MQEETITTNPQMLKPEDFSQEFLYSYTTNKDVYFSLHRPIIDGDNYVVKKVFKPSELKFDCLGVVYTILYNSYIIDAEEQVFKWMDGECIVSKIDMNSLNWIDVNFAKAKEQADEKTKTILTESYNKLNNLVKELTIRNEELVNELYVVTEELKQTNLELNEVSSLYESERNKNNNRSGRFG